MYSIFHHIALAKNYSLILILPRCGVKIASGAYPQKDSQLENKASFKRMFRVRNEVHQYNPKFKDESR